MEDLRREVTQLSTQYLELNRRVERQEENDKRHDEDIRQLYAAQEGTKAYVSQILAKIDQLEAKLFTLITQLTSTQKEEREADRAERSASNKGWQEFNKYVIGATVAVALGLVAYLIKNG